jgi:hypothetical protein
MQKERGAANGRSQNGTASNRGNLPEKRQKTRKRVETEATQSLGCRIARVSRPAGRNKAVVRQK